MYLKFLGYAGGVLDVAGGFKPFGPTYNSTPYVRLGYEGILGSKPIGSTIVNEAQSNPNFGLAGLVAALDNTGSLTLAGAADAVAPIGLYREDLGDMVNASMEGSYYFGFGEYYVAESRISPVYVAAGPAVGDKLTYNVNGQLTKIGASDAVAGGLQVGIVTFVGEYPLGNMYANAGLAANGGNFVGFILNIH